jgi:L-amino acid N-acyltransferase YncA
MSFTIRRPVLGDADRLGYVHVEAWRWAYRGQMPDDLLDSLRPESRAKAWQAWLSGKSYTDFQAWVAEVDGDIIGYAASSEATDDDAPDGTVELLMIYLLKSQLGTGIGHALITAAEEHWRETGYDLAMLWVLATNDRTRDFYERHGWKTDGAKRMQDFGEVEREVVRYVKSLN